MASLPVATSVRVLYGVNQLASMKAVFPCSKVRRICE